MRLETLVALPLLRKLKLNGCGRGIPLSGLKALSQLRELTLGQVESGAFLSLFQPPHALQLEMLKARVALNGAGMRALLHLPTLTQLEPEVCLPQAWPLLHQLPRLRRLQIVPYDELTDALIILLSASLALCVALDELTLEVAFSQEDGSDVSEEVQQRHWITLLRSVPLRRLAVNTEFFASFFAVLSDHLPRLDQLVLHGWYCSADVLASLAHPTLQQLELKGDRTLTEVEVQSLLHNPRLPQLRSCKSVSCSGIVFD
jgi:hypothetical protein